MTIPVGGVDGAGGAWLMVSWLEDRAEVQLLPTFDDVVARADVLELVVVGVDMPMGLPSQGPRGADLEARALLGARGATLFPTPIAATLGAADYVDACARSRAASGRALSKQAFNLLPAIREVRAAVTPAASDRFVEIHPESSFVQLAGEPLPPKRTAAGVGRRIQALGDALADPTAVLSGAPAGCAVDDVLDAMAVAWSARRFAAGEARVFGDGVDDAGYPLRIVA